MLKKRTLTIVFFLPLLIFPIFIYINNINIYGDFYLKIFNGKTDVTDKCYVVGKTIFGKENELKYQKGKWINSDWYYAKIIIQIEPNITDNSTLTLNFYNTSDELLIDYQVIKYSDFQICRLEINSIYKEKKYSERLIVFISGIKNIKNSHFIFLGFLLIIFVSFFFYHRKKIIFRNKSLMGDKHLITKEISFLLCLYTAVFLLLIFFFEYFILDKVFVFTGLWLGMGLFFICLYFLKRVSIFSYPFFKKLYLSVLGFIFVIVFIELIFRLIGINITVSEETTGAYHFFSNKNNIDKIINRPSDLDIIFSSEGEFHYTRKTNSMGLSDEEPDIEKHDNDFLIIGLGDSFTEGVGTHKDSTWLKFLERMIGQNDTINYKFLNAGIAGSDPVLEYRLLEEELLVLKPDIIVCAFGFDLEDIILWGGFERFEKPFKPNSNFSKIHFKETIYALSYVYRVYYHKLNKYRSLFLSEKEFKTKQKVALEIIKETIIKFKKLSQKNNFELLIVFYPFAQEIAQGKFEHWDDLITFSEKNGIKNLSLLSYYLEEEGMNSENVMEYFWKKDHHHNAKGYEAFARGILWKLEKDSLLIKN